MLLAVGCDLSRHTPLIRCLHVVYRVCNAGLSVVSRLLAWIDPSARRCRIRCVRRCSICTHRYGGAPCAQPEISEVGSGRSLPRLRHGPAPAHGCHSARPGSKIDGTPRRIRNRSSSVSFSRCVWSHCRPCRRCPGSAVVVGQEGRSAAECSSTDLVSDERCCTRRRCSRRRRAHHRDDRAVCR